MKTISPFLSQFAPWIWKRAKKFFNVFRLENTEYFANFGWMDYNIRLIQPGDDKALAAVIKTTLEELDCALDGTVYTDPNTDRMYSCYQDERSIYFIAESDGEILGGAGIAPIPNQAENYCELQRMFLKSIARGKGIGAILMRKCLDFAKSSDYDLVYIETFDSMLDARKLYEKSGFEYVDYQLGDTGHFSCGVKMILPLKRKKETT